MAELRQTKNLGDAERRIERQIQHDVTHNLEEVSEQVGDFERRTASDFRDTERRLDNRLDSSERRIESVTRHGFEETAEALADHDRRVETRLERLACEVGHEGDKTRGLVEKSELETRLYLRDREDRTHDLVRTLADRNLDEMRGFERRSYENEVKTRDLIRHEADERREQEFAVGLADRSRLRTKLDILEAERGEWRRDCDRDRRHRDGNISINIADLQGQAQSQRQRQRFDDDDRRPYRDNDRGMTV